MKNSNAPKDQTIHRVLFTASASALAVAFAVAFPRPVYADETPGVESGIEITAILGEESEPQPDLTLRIHWAVRDAWLNKRPVPKDLDWSSSAERVRAEECPAVGVVEQRHHTLNWLVCFGGDDWDHVDTPT